MDAEKAIRLGSSVADGRNTITDEGRTLRERPFGVQSVYAFFERPSRSCSR